ncbi:40065_t:CDS:2, partial [Gigaspora margarita]
NKTVPNVDGTLKEIMFKNSLPWVPFNELKNIQEVQLDMDIIKYSAEWTYPHKSGVRIRKVRLDLLTGSVDADRRTMYDYYQEHCDYDAQFSLAVINGMRPNIIENIVQSYSDLMKRCWDDDPQKRPSASKICNILTNWKNNMAKFYDFESVNYDESDEDEYKLYDVGDIIPILCEKNELPPHTPLNLYEEIKLNLIEEMKLSLTFQQSEIQNGDIICFQKVLTAEKIQKHTAAGYILHIPKFYQSLYIRVVVLFKPIHKDQKQKSQFALVLNREYTYDENKKKNQDNRLNLQLNVKSEMVNKEINIVEVVTNFSADKILSENQNENMTELYGSYGYNRPGAIFSIPLAYPYLKDQIIGPDYRIIQCDQIDSLGSWQDHWCAHHQRRLFLTWLKEQKEKSIQQQIEPAAVKNIKSDMVNKEINIVE